jgi:hypothetical protein
VDPQPLKEPAMAPHDTNTPKEARRHIVPLVGMAIIVIAVAVGFFWWIGRATEGADELDGTVTEEVPVEPAN